MTQEAALAYLQTRLQQLGSGAHPLATADQCRAVIMFLLCAEAIAGRLEAGTKLLKFRELYELAFGAKWETREGRERAARKRAKG
jgi:hypothetical protein